MNPDVQIWISDSQVIEKFGALKKALTADEIRRTIATECVRMTKAYLLALPPNKQNWPSTGFYAGAAKGTSWDITPTGLVISIDNEKAPGAMAFRFNGGTIHAKDKLLTIPARQEFYGHRAGEFTNLRFVMFASGAKALVIGKGGTGRVNFKTGKESRVKGAGSRMAMMIAYWLVESVTQIANSRVIPSENAYTETAIGAIVKLVNSRLA